MARWVLGTLALVTGLLSFSGVASAQLENADAWIDRNGDGNPDVGVANATMGVPVSFDIWVDSHTFTFTGFNLFFTWGTYDPPLAYFDRTAGTFTMNVNPAIGGSADPIDNFTNPAGLGRSNTVDPTPETGVRMLLSVTVNPTFAGTVVDTACIRVVTDLADIFNVPGYLVNGSTSSTFNAGVVTPSCFTLNGGGNASESTTWGKVKGLYTN